MYDCARKHFILKKKKLNVKKCFDKNLVLFKLPDDVHMNNVSTRQGMYLSRAYNKADGLTTNIASVLDFDMISRIALFQNDNKYFISTVKYTKSCMF